MANKKCYRVSCLEKFHEELCSVSFSAICEKLTKTGFFPATGLSIIIIPVLNSMPSLLLFVEKQLEKLEGHEQDKLWESFLRALHAEDPKLAFNIALECDKSVYHKREDPPKNTSTLNGAISPRIVIGPPVDFRHIASGSGSATAEITNLGDEDVWKL